MLFNQPYSKIALSALLISCLASPFVSPFLYCSLALVFISLSVLDQVKIRTQHNEDLAAVKRDMQKLVEAMAATNEKVNGLNNSVSMIKLKEGIKSTAPAQNTSFKGSF